MDLRNCYLVKLSENFQELMQQYCYRYKYCEKSRKKQRRNENARIWLPCRKDDLDARITMTITPIMLIDLEKYDVILSRKRCNVMQCKCRTISRESKCADVVSKKTQISSIPLTLIRVYLIRIFEHTCGDIYH